MLHWLGGSSKTWTEVMEGCSAKGFRCAAFDLPGFGQASALLSPGAKSLSVALSVDTIIESIRLLRSTNPGPWLLAGHSMGGKFSAIIARAALDGAPGLEDLRGVVLCSPSPPGPEPMDHAVRSKNINALGESTRNGDEDRSRAEAFVDDNTGKLSLLPAIRTRTVNDLLHMNRAALVAWFTGGSREDWAPRVGTLSLPALILAGSTEPALGPDAQRTHTLPHFPLATVVSLEGAGHLSPLERPSEIADRIVSFASSLGLDPESTSLSPEFRKLIDSDLTSRSTRSVLNQRLADDHASEPGILTSEEMLTLRAAARCIVPDCPFDIAKRLHCWLDAPEHDGWRHDTLPGDIDAWRVGLASLNAAALRQSGVPFSALDASRQQTLLCHARDGKLGRSTLDALRLNANQKPYTAEQMSAWFGDLHAEVTRIYVADPRTMSRIGFTGFADEAGFTQIRLDQREVFEREISNS